METPVIDCEIEVIADTIDFLVVNKPSSMPVHECGNFKYNSLQGILENEMGYNKTNEVQDDEKEKSKKKKKYKPKPNLFTVHRLDR